MEKLTALFDFFNLSIHNLIGDYLMQNVALNSISRDNMTMYVDMARYVRLFLTYPLYTLFTFLSTKLLAYIFYNPDNSKNLIPTSDYWECTQEVKEHNQWTNLVPYSASDESRKVAKTPTYRFFLNAVHSRCYSSDDALTAMFPTRFRKCGCAKYGLTRCAQVNFNDKYMMYIFLVKDLIVYLFSVGMSGWFRFLREKGVLAFIIMVVIVRGLDRIILHKIGKLEYVDLNFNETPLEHLDKIRERQHEEAKEMRNANSSFLNYLMWWDR